MTHDALVDYVERRSLARWAEPPLDPRPSRAVATIVHDEEFFFPIWLAYYSRFFAPEDIYVLDHDTTDGSTDGPGFNRIPVSHDGVDHQWMVDTVQALQHELQARYDIVLVTDVDEIVVPDPARGDLGGYLDRFEERFIACHGFELAHRPDEEAPYDPAVPIMSQRHWWFANAAYNKPILATEPLDWIPGFHGVTSGEFNFDPGLFLVHLHRLDYEECRKRHAIRRQREWAEDDLSRKYAVHNLLDAGDEFEDWFLGKKNGLDDTPVILERVPDHWEGAF
jgi:hypothetical protein